MSKSGQPFRFMAKFTIDLLSERPEEKKRQMTEGIRNVTGNFLFFPIKGLALYTGK